MVTAPTAFEVTPIRPMMPFKRPFAEVSGNLPKLDTPAGKWGSSPAVATASLIQRPKEVTLPPTPRSAGQTSSPVKAGPDPQLFIALRPRQTLLVGRKCPTPAPEGMHAFVSLPPTAKHASRVHARVTLTTSLRLIVEVTGQNGVKIGSRRLRANEQYDAQLENGTGVTLDFYGCLVVLEVEVPLRMSSSPPRSAPHESHPSIFRESSKGDAEPKEQEQSEGSGSDMEESDDLSELDIEEEPAVDASALMDSARDAGIDLYGTLASALVFQSRATLSTSELADLALETCPALARLEGWPSKQRLERALATGPFGRIDSAGVKDATGRDVASSWFYRPEADQDRERASALGPFAKAPRASQRGHAKQYYWAPLAERRRRH